MQYLTQSDSPEMAKLGPESGALAPDLRLPSTTQYCIRPSDSGIIRSNNSNSNNNNHHKIHE